MIQILPLPSIIASPTRTNFKRFLQRLQSLKAFYRFTVKKIRNLRLPELFFWVSGIVILFKKKPVGITPNGWENQKPLQPKLRLYFQLPEPEDPVELLDLPDAEELSRLYVKLNKPNTFADLGSYFKSSFSQGEPGRRTRHVASNINLFALSPVTGLVKI